MVHGDEPSFHSLKIIFNFPLILAPIEVTLSPTIAFECAVLDHLCMNPSLSWLTRKPSSSFLIRW